MRPHCTSRAITALYNTHTICVLRRKTYETRGRVRRRRHLTGIARGYANVDLNWF